MKMRLLSIRMVGNAYHRGTRCPGYHLAFVEGTTGPYYYPESMTLYDIMVDMTKKGYETAPYYRGLRHWIATGEGFNVLQGINC